MVTSHGLYTALVLALAVERLFELRLSHRNAAWAFAQGAREVGRGHYPAMVVLHAGFLVACLAEAWFAERVFPGVAGWVALAGLGLAQGLRVWAIGTLGRRWTTRVLVLPDTTPLGARGFGPITRGPYRFMRHPNYLAVIVEIACLPLVFGGYLTAVVFTVANAALLTVRIRDEERAQGPEYVAAFAQRRRFLPVTRHV
jgi:methyltransferase